MGAIMTADELKLTPEQVKTLREKYDDLKIQSMLFDMDIDLETLSLTERVKDSTPTWLRHWNEKRNQSDNDPASPDQGWA